MSVLLSHPNSYCAAMAQSHDTSVRIHVPRRKVNKHYTEGGGNPGKCLISEKQTLLSDIMLKQTDTAISYPVTEIP